MKIPSLNKWLGGIAGIRDLYLVGGTVRDLVMDKVPKDIDLACRDAKGLASRLASLHDAAIVPMEKKALQPCYRVVDRSCGDDYLDISELRGGTISEDLRRRDFTINSMALAVGMGDPGVVSSGSIIDPLGGLEDIRAGIIRMTGREAFTDDPLRLIRAFRFSAEFGFSIDPATLEAMTDAAGHISEAAAERITYELLLILATRRAASAAIDIDGCGVLDRIFPEIIRMKETPQNGYHHRDVWGHSLLVLQNTEDIINNLRDYFGDISGVVSENLGRDNRLPLLKLAVLFHDSGKPETRGLNEQTGRITFYGHDRAGAEIAGLLAGRMRLSSRDKAFMVRLVREHLRPLALSSPETAYPALMRWFRKLGDDIVPAVILAMADVMSSLGPESGEAYRRRFLGWGRDVVEEYFGAVKKILGQPPLISGDDLIELGMKAGPEIGVILQKVREAQDNKEVTSREEALELAGILMAR